MIKSYIIRRLAKENFESEVVPLRNAKSTLVLFGDLKGTQAAEAILLEQELLKVVPNLAIDICGVVKANKKEEFSKKYKHILFFTPKDFGMLLKPNNSDNRFRKLQVHTYDIVIDLSSANNHFVKRLLFYVSKKMRIGKNNPENLPFYDILIGTGEKPNEFAKSVVHYLNLLNLPQ